MPKVTSRDGTTIGYDQKGSGPALILVDGALGYRGFGPMPRLAELLVPHFTVLTYDRRGRGESGDTPPFAVEREIEDLEALIGTLGGSASLCGMSSGACLALEAALQLGTKVKKLAMYEPPYDSEAEDEQAWLEYGGQLSSFLAAGRNGDAVALFMTFVGAPSEMVEAMRHSPAWPQLEAVAPTLAHDRDAMGGTDRRVPIERARHLGMPTLVMNGSLTLPFIAGTAEALAAAIPKGQHLTLEGQRHDVDPAVLAPILVDFLED